MTLNLQLPQKSDLLKPTITVVGVGGAGGNAVNNMIASNLEGVNFVVANTDAQALDHTLANRTIQLGASITKGLGAGANPDVGRAAAEEAAEELIAYIEGSNMVFITAGMGGGTGTGAAPVVARIAREQGVLTVGVVTKPFQFEGTHRMRLAESGLKELQEYVDTLIIIPHQNLFRLANEKTTFADAFRMADEVLHSGVRGITDLMVKPGLINLDFADIRTVMREMGKAMMGTGEASGDKRAIEAAEAAISNPLLDDVSLKGARAALINITGGPDMTLFEVDEAANRIREEVDPDANIIFGSAFNEAMEGRVRVSVVATGIDAASQPRERANMNPIEQKKPYLFNAAREPQMSRPAVTAQGASRLVPPLMPQPQHVPQAQQSQPEPERAAAPVAPRAEAPRVPLASRMDNAEPQAVSGMMMREAYLPQSAPAKLAVRPAEPVLEHAVASPAPQPVAHMAAPATHASAGISPRTESRMQVAEEAPIRSLFSKLAEVSRSLAPKYDMSPRVEPERAAQVSERAKPEVVRKAAPMTDEDQFLDIPAFLRRQAN